MSLGVWSVMPRSNVGARGGTRTRTTLSSRDFKAVAWPRYVGDFTYISFLKPPSRLSRVQQRLLGGLQFRAVVFGREQVAIGVGRQRQADRGQSTLLPECLDDFIDESKARSSGLRSK
jgi:hypothetical protein